MQADVSFWVGPTVKYKGKLRVFSISRCNDQNPGDFLIFSKRGFRKTTEDAESTEGTKGENNNSLCPSVRSVV